MIHPSQLVIALCMLSSAAVAQTWKETSSKTTGDSPALIRKTVSNGSRTVTLNLSKFSTNDFTLRVVDQGNDSASRRYSSLRDAMEKTGCIAGINGGFYGADFSPLGLTVENGKKLSAFRNSSGGGLSTGLIWSGTGGIHIVRRENFEMHNGVKQAIQAGPMLVWQGAQVRGLSNEKWRPRTFVLTDWKGNWMLGTSSSVSLAALSAILDSSQAITEFTTHRAINLDGGRSTGFFLKQPDGSVVYQSEVSRVRNFLGIVKK